MKLSFGYSPCPNDTLAFYALAHRKIDLRGYEFSTSLEDVETLNQRAQAGTYDITKLSVAALGDLGDRYALLRSGGAMGRGCGPLLVSRPGVLLAELAQKPVAVPGTLTTAAMLMRLFAPETRMVPIPFEAIMPALCDGKYDFGVIIHEGRFTYETYGLTCLKDLGAWWEETTGRPIPLGCIAARSDLPAAVIRDVESIIRDSVIYGLSHREEAAAYIAEHAQEMEKDVIRRHIDLYVNEFTIDMGEEGESAIRYLTTRFPPHVTGGA